jgi:hypothetical protein
MRLVLRCEEEEEEGVVEGMIKDDDMREKESERERKREETRKKESTPSIRTMIE